MDEKSSQAEENTLEPILAFDMMNIPINDRDLSVARSATSHIINFFGSLTDEGTYDQHNDIGVCVFSTKISSLKYVIL